MRKCTKLWTTKDGTKIRICDMTDSHLANTIAMLERRAEEWTPFAISGGWSALCTVQGEMAELAIENGIRRLEEYGLDPNEITPLYDDLVKDRLRRETNARM